MNGLPEELMLSLERFDRLQTKHCRAFSAGGEKVPDMPALCFQRAKAFEDLKNQLHQEMMMQRSRPDSNRRKACRDRLEKIIKKEKSLASLAAEHRRRMMRQRRQMQNGKIALRGYQAAGIS